MTTGSTKKGEVYFHFFGDDLILCFTDNPKYAMAHVHSIYYTKLFL